VNADRPADGLSLLAERLQNAVADAARLSRTIEEASPDGRGRTWVERTDLVGRELGRQADLAAELARVVRRIVMSGSDDDGPALLHGPTGPARSGSARLPGTEGRHTQDSRGVVLPLLPDGDEPT
jgi:hypothetical protein